ncbi:MAG: hypothetical protein ACLQFR_09460 [Streptosporangiaceae bacterium]
MVRRASLPNPLLATRVRKARARSVCGLCPVLIEPGNRIGKVPGVMGWCHVRPCILQHQRSQDGAQ